MIKPNADRVEEVMKKFSDPANWTQEMWDAHEKDLKEIYEIIRKAAGNGAYLS